MDIIYIQREKLIDKYLSYNLSRQELNEFEVFYFDHPEIIDEIDKKRAQLLQELNFNRDV
jgi:hypothetical protein